MNFCIQDAFNLGWKLGAVVAGQATDALLTTYETEQRPIAEDLLASVDAQVAIQFDFTPQGLAFTRHFKERFVAAPGSASSCAASSTDWRRRTRLRPAATRRSACPTPRISNCCATTARPYGSTSCCAPARSSSSTWVAGALAGALAGLSATVVEGHPVRRPAALTDVTALVVRPDTYVGMGHRRRARPHRRARRDQAAARPA